MLKVGWFREDRLTMLSRSDKIDLDFILAFFLVIS